jgi:hypothetical protein
VEFDSPPEHVTVFSSEEIRPYDYIGKGLLARERPHRGRRGLAGKAHGSCCLSAAGFSGVVLQAFNSRDETQVAVKVLSKSLDKHEIDMLGKLKHVNIVKVGAGQGRGRLLCGSERLTAVLSSLAAGWRHLHESSQYCHGALQAW